MVRLLSMVASSLLIAAGCAPASYAPGKAARPYPFDLHVVEIPAPDGATYLVPRGVDIQVFRDGPFLEIVNSTATSYVDFDLWINQRYLQHVPALRAGQTIRLSLRDCCDERGEAFRAGGLFRTEEPVPVRLVEIQTTPEARLIGLIAISGPTQGTE